MKDIDALEAILTGTGQPSVIDMLRKRPLHIATPADAVRVEVAEDYDHLERGGRRPVPPHRDHAQRHPRRDRPHRLARHLIEAVVLGVGLGLIITGCVIIHDAYKARKGSP